MNEKQTTIVNDCPRCIGLRLKLLNAERRERILREGIDHLVELLRARDGTSGHWGENLEEPVWESTDS